MVISLKDTPFIWQPLTDFIFHIDAEKRNGFEKRILKFVSIIGLLSIIHAYISI